MDTGSKEYGTLLEALNESYFPLKVSIFIVTLKKTTRKCWHVITGMPAYKLKYVFISPLSLRLTSCMELEIFLNAVCSWEDGYFIVILVSVFLSDSSKQKQTFQNHGNRTRKGHQPGAVSCAPWHQRPRWNSWEAKS